MGIAIVPGFFGLVFLNLSKFRRFKAGAIEAELHDVVREAYATIAQMNNLAKTALLTHMDFLVATGRPSLLSAHHIIKRKDDIDEIATELGIKDDPDLLEANKIFFERFALDHVGTMSMCLNNPQEVRDTLHNMAYSKGMKLPDPDELREIVKDLNEGAKELAESLIVDYEYFLKNKQLRRPESLDIYAIRGVDH